MGGQDRRLIVQILEDFYTEKILEEDYKFSISGIYYSPQHGPLSSYLDYIQTLPLNQNPEVFWLHSNANLTAAINEGLGVLKNAMSMIAAFGGGGGDEEEEGASKAKPKSSEEIFCEIAAELEAKMPQAVDLLAVERSYPVKYDECLNTVLLMELGKMNRLLNKLNGTLKNVQLAVKGLVVFSPELEDVGNCLLEQGLVLVAERQLPLPEADAVVHPGPPGPLDLLQELDRERHPDRVLVLGVLLPAGLPHWCDAELRPQGADCHRPLPLQLRCVQARGLSPHGAAGDRGVYLRPVHGRRALGRRQSGDRRLLPEGAVGEDAELPHQSGRAHERQADRACEVQLRQPRPRVPEPGVQGVAAQGCALDLGSQLQLHPLAVHAHREGGQRAALDQARRRADHHDRRLVALKQERELDRAWGELGSFPIVCCVRSVRIRWCREYLRAWRAGTFRWCEWSAIPLPSRPHRFHRPRGGRTGWGRILHAH